MDTSDTASRVGLDSVPVTRRDLMKAAGAGMTYMAAVPYPGFAREAGSRQTAEAILDQADHVGSTSSILAYARTTPAREIIVVTESGILHQMQKENPDKVLIPAPGADETCNCNLCPHMRKNTVAKLHACMRDRTPALELDPELGRRALVPLQRMLDLSR